MPAAYGLIGYPLTHSFSPAYFKAKFEREGIDASYQLFPIPSIDAFPTLLEGHPQLAGLNVTIPYKEAVMPYLGEVDETARTIGAVNCISISKGILKGYNTDVTGFEQSLTPLLKPWHKNALILGTGGASLAVAFVLKKLAIECLFVSRRKGRGAISYAEVDPKLISDYSLVINTTPLGMHPNIDSCPNIPYDGIGEDHLLYDLVYNPTETLFLKKGKKQGAVTKNGLEMLELQAEASWCIWNGLTI